MRTMKQRAKHEPAALLLIGCSSLFTGNPAYAGETNWGEITLEPGKSGTCISSLISKGRHERYVINKEKFDAKVGEKRIKHVQQHH